MTGRAHRSSPSRRIAAALCLASGVLCAGLSTVYAERVRVKRFAFEERNGQLTITGGFREIFDARMRQRLSSGFATTVVMHVYLYRDGGGTPLAESIRSLRAVYDLWDREFLLQIERPRGRLIRRFKRDKEVVDRLTSFWRFPLAPIGKIDRGRQYFVAAIVEVNPMRPEVLSEVRRWLRRPTGRERPGSTSFFGSFVSIFVNKKISRAEQTFKVRSQPFFRDR
jgi:hypothetical protein